MPEGPELDVGQEGEDDQPETIGMEEMLYASQSTLENAEDGTILREEYHLKLVTESGHQYQVGCLTDAIVTSDKTAILVEMLRETFEAVEMGNMNEDDYFFELISPYFYYTSGNYRLSDQQHTTLLAMANTSSFESEENTLQENNVCTMLAFNESYNPEVLPFLELGEAATYPKIRIRENDIKFQCQTQRRTKKVKRKSCKVFGNDIIFQRNAPKRTKQVKMKSLHVFGNDIRFQRKAPRRTKQVKMKSLHVFGNDIKFQRKTPGQTKQAKMKFPHLFGTRSVGGNLSYILMIQLSLVFLAQSLLVKALPVNTEPDSPLTLTAGSDGVIPFACRNEQQSASKYYTVKFEKKDRPFYVDGAFDLEGLLSPDQAERFRVEYFEQGSAMSVEINIVSVSVEDQGTYIVLLIIQGETPEYHLMKRVVLIFIPPGPAICFLMLSERRINYEVHCHAKPGNGNSTLVCFQNGDKIPYGQNSVDTQIVYRRMFWLMHIDIPVSCCSHDIKEIATITQTSCDQFIYPRIEPVNGQVPPVHEISTNMTLTTRPLSMEEKKNQPFPDTISCSGCGRNCNWHTVTLPLIALFTCVCISNP